MAKNHKIIEKMLLFYEVAHHLSFSKAAEQLDISRSYLSQQIRSLEQDLHTQLLIRTTRKVRLTTEGDKVYQQARAIHNGLIDLERELDHTSDEVAGLIRITAPQAFADSFLMDTCHRFMQQYPEVRFELEVGHQLEDLHERNYDLAIRVTNQPPENMVAKKLISYGHWVVAAPDFFEANFVPQLPSDLRDLTCLSYPHWRTWLFDKDGQQKAVEVKERFAVNDNQILIKAALDGHGVIRVPEHLLWSHVQAGRLQRVFAEYELEKRQVWMIYPPKIEYSVRLQQFMAFLQEQLKEKALLAGS